MFVHISRTIVQEVELDQTEEGHHMQGYSQANAVQAKKKGASKKTKDKDAEAADEPQKEEEVNDDISRIDPVCGNFSKDDKSKMVFTLELIPSQVTSHQQNTYFNIAYKSPSFFKSFLQFFKFLNNWGVTEVEKKDIELLTFNGVPNDMIDRFKYDIQVARETDKLLLQECEQLEESVLNELISLLQRASAAGREEYRDLQAHIAEQGILVMIVKTLELIYYKCTTLAERDHELLGAEPVQEDMDDRPEIIAKEMLEPLVPKFLTLYHLLIKQNRENCERVTQFEQVMSMMMARYEFKLVSKILKEIYKRAINVHGSHGGDDSQKKGLFGNNVMLKWISKFQTIQYRDGYENISRQILYLNIVSMMCRDEHANGIYQYQVQALENILEAPGVLPISFGLQRKETDRPIVFIHKRADESDEWFLKNNPFLREIYKPHRTLQTNKDQGTSIVLDLYELTAVNLKVNNRLQPYLDYISTVINLYCHICLSRHQAAVGRLKDISLTFEHIVGCLTTQDHTQKSKKKKRDQKTQEPLDKKLIQAYIFAARVMYIDVSLFPSLSNYRNRCYYWPTIHSVDAHTTMYRWEKEKFFRGFEQADRQLIEEQEQHEKLAMGQLREHVYHFFTQMPDVLQTFLYSYESRNYLKKEVTTVLVLVFNYIDTATALINSELVDSKFVYRMLEAISIIFVSYHYQDMPNTEEDKSWITMVLKVAKKTRGCEVKVEELEFKALLLLEAICRFRMNAQILIFLQLFRQYVEDNTLPHVYHASSLFEQKFQIIFQLYQLSIGKNLTSKTVERMFTKLNTLLGDHANVLKKSSATKKRVRKAQGLEEEQNQLLNLADIILTEIIQEDGVEEEEIDEKGQAVVKGNNEEEAAKEDLGDDDEEESRRTLQLNDRYELDKFLLYVIFAKKTNHQIRNLAVNVLVQNFNQRDFLLNEVSKVELLISTQDQTDYQFFMQQHFMLTSMIHRIYLLDVQKKNSGGVSRQRDAFTYQRTIEDIVNILKGMTLNLLSHQHSILNNVGQDLVIRQEQDRLKKKQNMLRHMNVSNDLINQLLHRILESGFYSKELHYDMFNEVARYLFICAFSNESVQRTMLQHLTFLISLMELDVASHKVISQILSIQRENEEGLRFLAYLTDEHHKGNTHFNPYIFKLMTLAMARPLDGTPIQANQVFALKRFVKKVKFRKLLYLNDDHTTAKKLEIVIALHERIKQQRGFTQMTKADSMEYCAQEWEAYKVHASLIDFLSACVRKCLFGRLQARNIVSAEALFDAILSNSIPYLLKRKYIRLLFELYVRDVKGDTIHMDTNAKTFYDMMYYIVLEDLRQYARYYVGLMALPPPDEKRDNTVEALRRRTSEALQQKSVEDVRKRNMERTRQELENFKKEIEALSTLNHKVQLPLIDEVNKFEYWMYLTQFKKSRNEADGLLHFISDFYLTLREKGQVLAMSEPMVQVTLKIRAILMEISDDLNNINEQYSEYLRGVDHLLNVIEKTLSAVPDDSVFKKEDVIVENEDDQATDVKTKDGTSKIEDAARIAKLAAEKKARQEANQERDLQVKFSADKVLNLIRDLIIMNGLHIRKLFQINNFEQNYIMTKIDLKKQIKQIVGTQATNEEIDRFMEFIDKFSRDETEQRKAIQPDIAQESYVKTRTDPLQILAQNNGHLLLFNFRDLENLIRKSLQKLQYKPPVQKRVRGEMEEEPKLEKHEDELSRACNIDLKLFTKCFYDFYLRFQDRDEIADIVLKIAGMFNEAFDKRETEVINKFIVNMMQGFDHKKNLIYFLKILNMLLEYYLPTNPRNKHMQVKSKHRLGILQGIMKDCGLMEYGLSRIDQEDQKISNEILKLFRNLLAQSNRHTQDFLLQILKRQGNNFKLFSYVKTRLLKASEYLIQQVDVAQLQQDIAIKAPRYYQDQSIDSLYSLFQQPIFLPSQSLDGQGRCDMESDLKTLSGQQRSDELCTLLTLIQLMCDNSHTGFQNYMRSQEENQVTMNSVNILELLGEIFITLTERLNSYIFSDFILHETIAQLVSTLIDFLHGPNQENQRLLGKWKRFTKAVNYYLQQDFGYYTPNTNEQKHKLSMLRDCTKLITAIVESVSSIFKGQILKDMIPELCVENLLDKVVEIFHFKVGVEPARQAIYYQDKNCTHYVVNSLVKRENMCERGDYCEFGFMVESDQDVIDTGFSLFIFLYAFKEAMPDLESLEAFDYHFKNEVVYQAMRKAHQEEIAKLSSAAVADKFASEVRINEIVIEEEGEAITDSLLERATIREPTTRIYTELAKKGHHDYEGGNVTELKEEQNVFDIKDSQKVKKENQEKGAKEAGGFFRRCCRRFKYNKVSVNENAATEHNMLVDDVDEAEGGQTERGPRIDHTGDSEVHKKENLIADAIQNYSMKHYMLDEATRFYSSNLSSIEINFQNSLSKIMFRIPAYCMFLSKVSQHEIIYQANRKSHIEKLKDFFRNREIYQAEMKAIQRLSRRSKLLRTVAENSTTLSVIQLGVIVTINFLFLGFYQVKENNTTDLSYQNVTYAFYLLGFFQCIVSNLNMVSYITRYHGKIHEKYQQSKEAAKQSKVNAIKGSVGYALLEDAKEMALAENQVKIQAEDNSIENEILMQLDRAKVQRQEFEYTVKIFFRSIILDRTHAFNVLYVMMSVAAMTYNLLYCLMLLDFVAKVPALQMVVQGLLQNRLELMFTFVLLFVLIYIFSFIGFKFMNSDYDPETGGYCLDLISCYSSTLSNGLRNFGGIGDSLIQVAKDDDNRLQYWSAYVFSVTFFIIISVLMMNLVLGIIIDAFAEVRDERNSIQNSIRQRCFICGLNRFDFENRRQSWRDHIEKDHNAYAYLYFIIYVTSKPLRQCTGIEKAIREFVNQEDPTFFPMGQCLSIGKIDDDPNDNDLDL